MQRQQMHSCCWLHPAQGQHSTSLRGVCAECGGGRHQWCTSNNYLGAVYRVQLGRVVKGGSSAKDQTQQGSATHACILPCCFACACRPWTTFLPLAIVLGVAMVKEAVEDYKRHKQDVDVNNRAVEVSAAMWKTSSSTRPAQPSPAQPSSSSTSGAGVAATTFHLDPSSAH